MYLCRLTSASVLAMVAANVARTHFSAVQAQFVVGVRARTWAAGRHRSEAWAGAPAEGGARRTLGTPEDHGVAAALVPIPWATPTAREVGHDHFRNLLDLVATLSGSISLWVMQSCYQAPSGLRLQKNWQSAGACRSSVWLSAVV